jgi:hypothetical protein
MLRSFWAFIHERHATYVRKRLMDTGRYFPDQWCPRPDLAIENFSINEAMKGRYNTLDPILRQYRFCNVFRELDRVTIWIRENIREPYADHPHLWFMLAIARTINWPEALGGMINGVSDNPESDCASWPTSPRFTPKMLGDWMDEAKATGHKLYTGAYMIRAESNPKAEWYSWTKQQYIAQIVLGRLWEDRAVWQEALATSDLLKPTLQGIWELFQSPRYIGWGPFMAGQVVTDLRHTRYLRDAPDLNKWTALGPGSTRGLNRLLGSSVDDRMSQAQGLELMLKLYHGQAEFRAPWLPEIELSDIQNCLCEFDKHQRVKNGEGKPRALYVPGRGW